MKKHYLACALLALSGSVYATQEDTRGIDLDAQSAESILEMLSEVGENVEELRGFLAAHDIESLLGELRDAAGKVGDLEEIAHVRVQLREIRKLAAERLGEFKDLLKSEEVAELLKICDRFDDTLEDLRDDMDEIRGRVRNFAHRAGDWMVDHPTASAFIASAIILPPVIFAGVMGAEYVTGEDVGVTSGIFGQDAE